MSNTLPLDLNSVRAVLDYLNIGAYVTDRDRRIICWNRKAEEITGYRAADVVGHQCHDNILCHIDKDERALCTSNLCPLLRSMTLARETDEPVLVFAKRADGRRVAVSVSAAPIKDAQGNVIAGIETFRDETASLRDLEFASLIQRNLLPSTLPQVPGYAFDICYYPHDLVGGDFYDLRALDDGQIAIFAADVRGHGVSAALYTMWLKSLGENQKGLADQPGEFLTALNGEFSRFIVQESFATAVQAVLNPERNEIVYSNAAHPLPLHYHSADKSVTSLESHGLPLGITADGKYDAETVMLEPGDLMLIYTDGITESVDRTGNMLRESGLSDLLRTQVGLNPDGLPERIYRHVRRECGNVSLADDVLIIAVRRTGDGRRR